MSGRTLTAAVNTELGQSTTAPRFLVEIIFDSGPFRVWNGIGDLSAFGDIFSGIGRLGRIEPITETQETVSSGIEMVLDIIPTANDPDAVDSVLNISLAETYQGRAVTIWQAQIDHTTDPPSLIADPFIRFKGFLDVMRDRELPGGQATIVVTAENRLIDLGLSHRRTWTPEDHKSSHSGDTFFDEVVMLEKREIKL